MKYAVFAAALALAACQPAAEKPAKPSGPARTVAVEPESADLSGAASVTDIHFVKDADVKLFSTAGGDPAINGLYTYLAIFTPPDGWTRIYMIGDFNSWEVIEESPARVVLKISRSWLEEGTGDVKTTDEKLIIDLPADPETPISVSPAI